MQVRKALQPGGATRVMQRNEMASFVAIDFETADPKRDSACQVGMVLVEQGRITDRFTTLLRPPRREFSWRCVDVHGITWEDVRDAPTFAEAWPAMNRFLASASHLAAHNAAFDRSVLLASCETNRLAPPAQRFVCTVAAAKATWQLPNGRLPTVCDFLGVELNHHDAASDAEACARILLAARRAGYAG